jgi:hypothetical protein
MIGALNHRRGDRVSNRDRAALERCAARANDLVGHEKIRGSRARGRTQILTEPTKQAGRAGPKA